MALVLTRREGERFRLKTTTGEIIWIIIKDVRSGKVRLAIEAPDSVHILREEVTERPTKKER